jgi:predicted P-loop ATPase
VVDYLAEVQGRWDGTKRIDTWLTDYCEAPDTPFARAVGRMHLVASVRRPRQPGCKYDYILVTEAPEGKNKSTAIRVLAGKENFSDQTILGVDDKMAQELMTGVWLYEIADLTDITKADVNRVKAFASRDTDRARPAYGRCVEKRPRRCTLWGTTNDQQYMKSQTGNRRFLPVPAGRIDIEALARDRDQLWGEAAVAEAAGETIALDESLWATAAEEQEKRRTVHPWEDLLADIPNEVEVKPARGEEGAEYAQIIYRAGEEERVATAHVLSYVLKVNPGYQHAGHGQRLALIMERLGWQRPKGGTLRVGGKSVRGYSRPVAPEKDVEPKQQVVPKQQVASGRVVVRGMCETGTESELAIRLMAEGGKEVCLPKSEIGMVDLGNGRWDVAMPARMAKEKGLEFEELKLPF